jgi:hypothetical protein
MTHRLALPPILNEIADLVGQGAALRIAEARGGTKIYIPKETVEEDHWLAVAIGFDLAVILAENMGGMEYEIPLGPLSGSRSKLHAAIRRSLRNGSSVSMTARLAGIHQRTVRRHKSRLTNESDLSSVNGGSDYIDTQGDLFP